MSDIHTLVTVVHTQVDRAEVDINWYVDKLTARNSTNWSRQSLPMIWLAGDAKRMHALAVRLETLLNTMTRIGAEHAVK